MIVKYQCIGNITPANQTTASTLTSVPVGMLTPAQYKEARVKALINKVAPELRDRIIQYQEECDEVLWNYWTAFTPQALLAKLKKQGLIVNDDDMALKYITYVAISD